MSSMLWRRWIRPSVSHVVDHPLATHPIHTKHDQLLVSLLDVLKWAPMCVCVYLSRGVRACLSVLPLLVSPVSVFFHRDLISTLLPYGFFALTQQFHPTLLPILVFVFPPSSVLSDCPNSKMQQLCVHVFH